MSPASSSRATVQVHPTLDDLVRLQFDARDFSLLPRQPVHSLLSGRHASRLRGRGLTFEELRRYRPGDDIRSIDWRATARLRAAHVRVYSEERDRPVLLVVDQRTTMFFGSARTTKATVAAEAAALTAWRTIDRGDRIGAIIFDDDQFVEIKPQRSRGNVLRICHELVRLNGKLSATGESVGASALNGALLRAANVALHDHLVILITDYDGDDETTRELTTRLAAHNDVLAVLVYDPLGIAMPAGCGKEATDGGRRLAVPEGGRFTERFAAEFRARCDQICQRLRAVRIPLLPICTHEPVPEQVIAALGETTMKPDPASLDNLRDIVTLPPVRFWPPAPGWWVVFGILAVAAVAVTFRAWRVWHANAYRRAALRELQGVASVAAIAEILKRTALVAFPRTNVAALSGNSWCQWLGRTAGLEVPPPVTQALSEGVFAGRDTVDVAEVAAFAAHWIDHHRLPTEGRTDREGP